MSRFIPIYKTTALIILNTIVFLFIINLLFALVNLVYDKFNKDPISEKYKIDLSLVYPDMEPSSSEQLVKETWRRRPVYEPFTLFKERTYSGKYVNVSSAGFRLIEDQGPWPIDPRFFNIFFFGGSTSFGYGVSDEQTIPSQLQKYLNSHRKQSVRVYNFARGSYYLFQEMILLERLLSAGYKPDMALFLDGLNEFLYSKGREPQLPKFHAINRLDEQERIGLVDRCLAYAPFLEKLPAYQFVGKINFRHMSEPEPDRQAVDEKAAQSVISRYLNNKTIISGVCEKLNVYPVFVIQPVPGYKLDLQSHLFPLHKSDGNSLSIVGYPLFKENVRARGDEPNLIWAADMQEGLKGPLYVDAVHYNARMSKIIAEFIGGEILTRSLIAEK
ncbi:MAG: SGNH/GDSL hydrolase family protein [Syntrophobacteraceae bacterium]